MLDKRVLEWRIKPQVYSVKFLGALLFFLFLSLNVDAHAESVSPMNCSEVSFGSPSYKPDNIAALAAKANLEDPILNRYQEDVVSSLCGGTEKYESIDKWIDLGYVRAEEAEALSRALGKHYKAPVRSSSGRLYERINDSLLEKGLCSACASNLAEAYGKAPQGKAAALVDAALSGDTRALAQLKEGSYATPIPDQKPVEEGATFDPTSMDNPFFRPLLDCFSQHLINPQEADAMARTNDLSFLNPPSVCLKRMNMFVDFCTSHGTNKEECQGAYAALWIAINSQNSSPK